MDFGGLGKFAIPIAELVAAYYTGDPALAQDGLKQGQTASTSGKDSKTGYQAQGTEAAKTGATSYFSGGDEPPASNDSGGIGGAAGNFYGPLVSGLLGALNAKSAPTNTDSSGTNSKTLGTNNDLGTIGKLGTTNYKDESSVPEQTAGPSSAPNDPNAISDLFNSPSTNPDGTPAQNTDTNGAGGGIAGTGVSGSDALSGAIAAVGGIFGAGKNKAAQNRQNQSDADARDTKVREEASYRQDRAILLNAIYKYNSDHGISNPDPNAQAPGVGTRTQLPNEAPLYPGQKNPDYPTALTPNDQPEGNDLQAGNPQLPNNGTLTTQDNTPNTNGQPQLVNSNSAPITQIDPLFNSNGMNLKGQRAYNWRFA